MNACVMLITLLLPYMCIFHYLINKRKRKKERKKGREIRLMFRESGQKFIIGTWELTNFFFYT